MYHDTYGKNKTTNWDNIQIKKAVIYGHSLNEMDYDYFIYLFTVLKFNTIDISQMGQVEFLYNVYDPQKSIEIRDSFTEAVYRLLNTYEEFINIKEQRVLINMLRFSGKLIIREINIEEMLKVEYKLESQIIRY